MHFNGEIMEYSNRDLSGEQIGLSCMKLPEVCTPVYREIVKEMAEVIKNAQIRDIFYSLSTGEDMQIISKRTGISLRNLAYMYKKASREVRLEWKPYSEWKQKLDNAYVRCRNYESLLLNSHDMSRQSLRNVIIVVKDQDIPSEYVNLLVTPLEELEINFRTLRALRKYNIYQLEDLLRFIKYNGFDALRIVPGMGIKSTEQLYEKLKDKNIRENKNTCALFPYLFV